MKTLTNLNLGTSLIAATLTAATVVAVAPAQAAVLTLAESDMLKIASNSTLPRDADLPSLRLDLLESGVKDNSREHLTFAFESENLVLRRRTSLRYQPAIPAQEERGGLRRIEVGGRSLFTNVTCSPIQRVDFGKIMLEAMKLLTRLATLMLLGLVVVILHFRRESN